MRPIGLAFTLALVLGSATVAAAAGEGRFSVGIRTSQVSECQRPAAAGGGLRRPAQRHGPVAAPGGLSPASERRSADRPGC